MRINTIAHYCFGSVRRNVAASAAFFKEWLGNHLMLVLIDNVPRTSADDLIYGMAVFLKNRGKQPHRRDVVGGGWLESGHAFRLATIVPFGLGSIEASGHRQVFAQPFQGFVQHHAFIRGNGASPPQVIGGVKDACLNAGVGVANLQDKSDEHARARKWSPSG